MRVLRPVVDPRTYRALGFALAQLVLGALAFAFLLAGWIVTLVFAITPLVVPLLVGLRYGAGALARITAYLTGSLLGTAVSTPLSSGGTGFWQRGLNVVRDRVFWTQQAHLLLAWPVALVPVTLVAFALQLLTYPIWYRFDSNEAFGLIRVDTLQEALPIAGVGLVLVVVASHVLALYAASSRRLAARLLEADGGPATDPAQRRARALRAWSAAALSALAIAAALFVVWALTPGDYVWPIWPVISLALLIGAPGWVLLVLGRPEIGRLALGSSALAIQVGLSALVFCFLVAVWALAGGGYFWPAWAALGLALAAGLHAAVLYLRRAHRVEELERSRAAAVDSQETELRRIERDLHDGAQASLVALGMSLGLAEEKLQTDPEAAQALLGEARADAQRALEELRALARGIHPPILADRGLEAAVSELAARSPVPVALSADLPERLPNAVETAAYFVVAEGLANAIKHAGAQAVQIRLARENGALVAEIRDDGRGGADPAGSGLRGLEQRVRALDGSLVLDSPPGGPTTVRAELPCG